MDKDAFHKCLKKTNNFTKYCKENNKTSVIMSVDLPYDVQLYPYADAILAVYGDIGSAVDPTEAIVGGTTTSKEAYGPNIIAGVEVALGTFGATGTLPVNVTKYDANSNSYTDEIVYKRGHGITYDAKTINRDELENKVAELEKLEKIDDIKSRRIVAEHLRSSIMIIADGGRPSNIDRGYVLRRLIRRMTRHMSKLQIDLENISDLIDLTINNLNEMYPELQTKRDIIKNVIIEEKDKFIKTLGHGEKEFEKVINKLEQENKNVIDGKTIFKLYETYGFPPEITADLAQEKGYKIDLTEFDKLFKEHQEKSRLGSEQKFKGGLAEQNEITTAYHTATHLLHQALRNVLGDHVKQSGSNITTERLRFDFSHPEKMTPEQIKQVEDIVNEQIKRDLNVVSEEMPLEEAKKSGAIGLFENKYGDTVKVYTIGDFSKEICGGPHVKHTGELGHFKIKKEESSSAGIRRIKAILE